MAVTIKELSQKCGLSVSTVSKALNGYTDISEATREMVMKAAKEMGYYPNAHARALKTKRSYNLGVLFADDNRSGLTHSFFSPVLESFKQEAERMGYDVTFISHNIGSSKMSYLAHCHQREVDGVCIACIDFSDAEVIELVNSDIPIVTIDHLFNSRTCIQSNNPDGMNRLVHYVYGMGHRAIGYIHGKHSTVTDTRLAAFHRAAESLGLNIISAWLGECQYNDPASVYKEAQRILSLKNRPTCLLVSDDYAALGALEAIADKNLKVPDDISVAGFDGIRMTQLLRPRLTTIKQDTARMGAQAAQHLVELIESPKTTLPEIAVIPCTLIVGETVGQPRVDL